MHWYHILIFRTLVNTNSTRKKKRFTPRNKGVLITTTLNIYQNDKEKIKSKKLLDKIAELEISITRLDGVNDVLKNGQATWDDQHNLLIQTVELVM